MKRWFYRTVSSRVQVEFLCQRCFHRRHLHSHYRKGSNCGVCVHPPCPKFAWRKP